MKFNKNYILLSIILLIGSAAYFLIPSFEREEFNSEIVEDISSGNITTTTSQETEENEKEWLHFNQQENTLIDFKNYFTSNGIRTKAENLVENHVNMAIRCLDAIPGKKNKDLLEYSNLIMNRDY